MNTETAPTDNDALLERLTAGKPLDPETYRRIREKGERITDELRKKYGEMNIALDLIRSVRDEA